MKITFSHKTVQNCADTRKKIEKSTKHNVIMYYVVNRIPRLDCVVIGDSGGHIVPHSQQQY